MRVQVDPVKLAALGMQSGGCGQRHRQRHGRSAEGSIRRPKAAALPIYTDDQITKAAPWNDMVVAYKNGAPVRIRDIGIAVDGPEN